MALLTQVGWIQGLQEPRVCFATRGFHRHNLDRHLWHVGQSLWWEPFVAQIIKIKGTMLCSVGLPMDATWEIAPWALWLIAHTERLLDVHTSMHHQCSF